MTYICKYGLSKITVVDCNFKPSKSTVVEHLKSLLRNIILNRPKLRLGTVILDCPKLWLWTVILDRQKLRLIDFFYSIYKKKCMHHPKKHNFYFYFCKRNFLICSEILLTFFILPFLWQVKKAGQKSHTNFKEALKSVLSICRLFK